MASLASKEAKRKINTVNEKIAQQRVLLLQNSAILMTSSNYVPLLWTTPKWINPPPPILFLQENLEPPFYDFSKISTPSQQTTNKGGLHFDSW